MPDESRFVISPEPRIEPEDVERKQFSTAFRKGYDQNEVRAFLFDVAGELREAIEREKEIRSKLSESSAQVDRLEELDERVVLERLGEETARLLRSAHNAATEIKTRANDEVQQLHDEANEEIEQLRAEVLRESELRLAEANEEVERRLAHAEMEAEHIVANAEARAEELRQLCERDIEVFANETLERCRGLINEAQAARERLLGDLGRRGRIAAAQVEALKAGRERLLESYRGVRKSLEEATDDLQRADSEARAASETATARVAGQADITTAQLIDELGLQEIPEEPDDINEILVSWNSVDFASPRPPALRALPGGADEPHLRVVPNPDVAELDGEVAGAESIPIPDAAKHAHLEAVAGEMGEEGEVGQEGAEGAPSSEEVVDSADEVLLEEAELMVEVIDESQQDADLKISEDGAPEDGIADAKRPTVEELFARLREEREHPDEAVEVVVEVEINEDDEVTSIEVETDSPSEASQGGEDAPDDAVAPDDAATGEHTGDVIDLTSSRAVEQEVVLVSGAETNAVVVETRERVSRLVKRYLQDEENEVLHKVRNPGRGRNKTAPKDALPTAASRQSALVKLIAAGFDEVADAGVSESGADTDGLDSERVRQQASSCATDLAAGLGESLAATLEKAPLDEVDERELADMLSATYREWRLTRTEEVIGRALAVTYSLGPALVAD